MKYFLILVSFYNIEELKKLIYRLLEKTDTLKQQNTELKARLNENSSNKSPSSNYFKIKPAFTKPTKRKEGGTPVQIYNPYKVIVRLPDDFDCEYKFSPNQFYYNQKLKMSCCSKFFYRAKIYLKIVNFVSTAHKTSKSIFEVQNLLTLYKT